MPVSVDIFCRVVDNYGDIGVSWRLARQLTAEYGCAVRLFVDDVASFEKIAGLGQKQNHEQPLSFSSSRESNSTSSGQAGDFEHSQKGISHDLKKLSPWRRPGSNFLYASPSYQIGSRPSPGRHGVMRSSENGNFSKPQKTVAPAKAGVQFSLGLSKLPDWIPAFAGKTRGFEKFPNDKDNNPSALPSIFAWNASPDGDFGQIADIVIEAFGCELPASYLDKMASREAKPIWLNLEYLSAEPWVAEHHLLPSPHPRLPLTKTFFFPGFTAGTGGLIREATVAAVDDISVKGTTANVRIFVFGYDTAPMNLLVQAIIETAEIARVTIPEGALANRVHIANETTPLDKTKLDITAFVPQTDFDAVLAAHDILIVRGEDSFVRAQFAAKPFIWQIYPQAEGAHLLKLNAFLDIYCVGLSVNADAALRTLWVTINDEKRQADQRVEPIKTLWMRYCQHLPELQLHARKWQKHMLAQPDLARNLMTFCQKLLKI